MIFAAPLPGCARLASPVLQPTPLIPLRYRGVAAGRSCKPLRRNGDSVNESDCSDESEKTDAFTCARASARAYEQSFWRSHRSRWTHIYPYIPISIVVRCVCVCNGLAVVLRCGLLGGSASSAGFVSEQGAAAAPIRVARADRHARHGFMAPVGPQIAVRCMNRHWARESAPRESLRAGRRLRPQINHLGQLCPAAAGIVRTSGSCGVRLPLSRDIRHLTARAVGAAVRTRRGATPGRKAERFQRVARRARPPGRGAAAGALDARLYFGRRFLPFGKIFAVRTPGRGGGRVNDE